MLGQDTDMSFFDLPPAESLDAPPVSSVGVVSGAAPSPVGPVDASGTVADSTSSKSKTGLFVFIAIAVTAIAIFGFAFAPSRASIAVSVSKSTLIADPTGQVAPTFNGNLLDGSGKGGLGGVNGIGAGKVTVVNFWASWCGPCKLEAPVIAAGEKRWRDQGVVFVGVNSRDTTEPARAFEKKYGIAYPSVVDPNAEIGKHYYVTGFPETYFLSKSGKVVAKFVSSIDAGTLDADIQAALNAS
jgi:cytochrome c biogenesis protein CcmG/thiol:disulfide interchange protein DsbE